MGNMQLYSLVVTTDADVQEREALAEAHHHQPMVEEAPAVLTFCADFHRFSRWCEQRDAAPGYGNFVSFINAHSAVCPGVHHSGGGARLGHLHPRYDGLQSR